MDNKNLLDVFAKFFESKLSLSEKIGFELIEVNEVNSYFVGSAIFDDPTEPLNLVFSVPLNHTHFYFTITEANPEVFKRELVLLQHYSECVSNLCLDHSIPSSSLELDVKGYAGYVMVSPAIFHNALNEAIVVDDISIAGIGVLPVTPKEIELKRESGTDALYEYWDSNGKDCVAF